ARPRTSCSRSTRWWRAGWWHTSSSAHGAAPTAGASALRARSSSRWWATWSYALQSLYSNDFEQAVKNVAFFYVPFALLLKLLVTIRWSRRLVIQCFGLAV